jgi:hypothetical protein
MSSIGITAAIKPFRPKPWYSPPPVRITVPPVPGPQAASLGVALAAASKPALPPVQVSTAFGREVALLRASALDTAPRMQAMFRDILPPRQVLFPALDNLQRLARSVADAVTPQLRDNLRRLRVLVFLRACQARDALREGDQEPLRYFARTFLKYKDLTDEHFSALAIVLMEDAWYEEVDVYDPRQVCAALTKRARKYGVRFSAPSRRPPKTLSLEEMIDDLRPASPAPTPEEYVLLQAPDFEEPILQALLKHTPPSDRPVLLALAEADETQRQIGERVGLDPADVERAVRRLRYRARRLAEQGANLRGGAAR